MIGGVLLNFHAAGPIPVVGLTALAYGLFAADRAGFILDNETEHRTRTSPPMVRSAAQGPDSGNCPPR